MILRYEFSMAESGRVEADTTGNVAGLDQVSPQMFCSLKFTSQALTRTETLWTGHRHGCSISLHTASPNHHTCLGE